MSNLSNIFTYSIEQPTAALMTVIKGLPLNQPIPGSLVKINNAHFVLIGETRALKIPLPKDFNLNGSAAYVEVTIERTKPTPRFLIRVFNAHQKAAPLHTGTVETGQAEGDKHPLTTKSASARQVRNFTGVRSVEHSKSFAGVRSVENSKDFTGVRSVEHSKGAVRNMQGIASKTEQHYSIPSNALRSVLHLLQDDNNVATQLSVLKSLQKLVSQPPPTVPPVVQKYLQKLITPPEKLATLSQGKWPSQQQVEALRNWGENPWQRLSTFIALNSDPLTITSFLADNQTIRQLKLLSALLFFTIHHSQNKTIQEPPKNLWELLATVLITTSKKTSAHVNPEEKWADLLIKQLAHLLAPKSKAHVNFVDRTLVQHEATPINIFTIPFPHSDSYVSVQVWRDASSSRKKKREPSGYRIQIKFDFGEDKTVDVRVEFNQKQIDVDIEATPFFFRRLSSSRLEMLNARLKNASPSKAVHLDARVTSVNSSPRPRPGQHWEA